MDDHEIAREYAKLLRTKLGDRLLSVVLFGSRARGAASVGSDFDVLIVVDERTAEVRELTLDASVEMMNRYETLFAPLTYSRDEWQYARRSPLGWAIEQDGVAL